MTVTGPNPGPPPLVSNPQLAMIVYVLYLAGYVTGGLTWIIGVIIAHVQVSSADPVLASHYRFQIRTFWIGVLYIIIGCILLVVLVGFVVFAWLFIWSLVRNIKGLLLLNENRPIVDPGSWLFG
jgi:uncharacterized membrane protein